MHGPAETSLHLREDKSQSQVLTLALTRENWCRSGLTSLAELYNQNSVQSHSKSIFDCLMDC